MKLAEMVRKNREEAGVSRAELAKKLGVPEVMVACIEEPEADSVEAVKLFASALGVKPEVFTGEEPRGPTEEEIRAAQEAQKAKAAAKAAAEAAAKAKYPAIREFILDPKRCANPQKAAEMFGGERFSIAERNVVLFLCSTALYHFCDTSTSEFSFDTYLFKRHESLLRKFERELAKENLSEEEKAERLGFARGDVFRCDRVENIAILVLEDFAAELEQKLENGVRDFDQDLDMPFVWEADDELMKIAIRRPDGELLHEIKLLDVKEKNS